MPAVDVRLSLYMRITRLTDADWLYGFEAELEDRFGSLPEAAQTLLAVTRARLLCRSAGIARVDAGPAAIALTPRPGFSGQIAGLTEKEGRLLRVEREENDRRRLETLIDLLEDIGSD